MKSYLFIGFLLAIIAITLAWRLLPHIPNFAPVGALALFTGLYLAQKSKWVLFLPLVVMFLADLVIGVYDLKLMAVVYGSFFFYGIFGLLVKEKKNFGTITLATLAGSFLFYLFTNFAVWVFSPWYAHTIEGLMLSYTMAFPFFKYTLLGDLFFVGVFVGAYELAIHLLRQKVFKLALGKLLIH